MLVVYQALYGDKQMYICPYTDFIGMVDHKKHPDIKQMFTFECDEESLTGM